MSEEKELLERIIDFLAFLPIVILCVAVFIGWLNVLGMGATYNLMASAFIVWLLWGILRLTR